MDGQPFAMTEAAANVQLISSVTFLVCLVMLIYGMALSKKYRYRGSYDWIMAIPMVLLVTHTLIYYGAVLHYRFNLVTGDQPITYFTSWSAMLRLHEGITLLCGIVHWVVLIRDMVKHLRKE